MVSRGLWIALFVSAMIFALGIPPAAAQDVPRVVPFSGIADGHSPPAHPVAITVSIYADATGGAPPLFAETQIVKLGQNRRFEVLLGSATGGGLPDALFAGNEARWIGVQVENNAEQTPRVMIASLPYALKSANSDQLGGLPAANYLTKFDPTGANEYTDEQVGAEAAARAGADTTLQSNIDAEAAARTAADTTLQSNIDGEAAARIAADTTLQSNFDAEAAARAAADATLQDNINDDAASRAAADTTLQGNIDVLAADAVLAVNAGFGLSGGGSSGVVAVAADPTVMQRRVNGVCGSASAAVSVNEDGSVNCVSVDTNPGDDITSLSAGSGISITGSGDGRTITNTGDANEDDDITSLFGSGGVTVSGSGGSRTIGHNTWSCPAGSAVRSIDSDGIVTCETDDVGSGGTNADTLDGLDSQQFVRADVDGSIQGNLSVTGSVSLPFNPLGPAGSGIKWSNPDPGFTATLTLDGNGPNGLSYQGNATMPCFIVRAVTGTSASGAAMARMCADGTITASVKNFVEAHPTRADTEIYYASLEGPEAAMYLRGSGRSGSEPARIEFPEHFTVLVAGETVTASVTSVGRCPGGLFVAERNERGMVIARETPDGAVCDFDYLVMGVRSRYRDWKAVREIK